MRKELLWEELNKWKESDNRIDYEGVTSLVNNNPSLAVEYMDDLFCKISAERMKQLAEQAETEEMDLEDFDIVSIITAWQVMKSKYRISDKEYNCAIDYSMLSKKKFKTGLTEDEAVKILDHVLSITENWLEGNAPVTQDPGQVTTKNKPVNKETVNVNAHTDSQFIAKLQVLQTSSNESVSNANSFGPLSRYMHVDRPIQMELENTLKQVKENGVPSLILLCGSVGDGKSHLLAYINKTHPELLEGFGIHNDSTESYDSDKNSVETLERVLASFEKEGTANNHLIIAINLGVLHNFYSKQRKLGKFNALCDFIESSGVFDKGHSQQKSKAGFHLINFAETQPYMLTNEGPKSPFFIKLIDKITNPDDSNPFYQAWLQDRQRGITTAAHYNYQLLQHKEVKESIVQALIEVMIKKKVFLSNRAFYNFIYEIIVPVKVPKNLNDWSISVKDMLPNLMFGHPDRSPLLAALNDIDPLKRRLEATDCLVTNFILTLNPYQYVVDELGEELSDGAWNSVNDMHQNKNQTEFARLLVRQHALIYRKEYSDRYSEFLKYLYAFYSGDEDDIGHLFELIEKVIYAWKGSPRDRFVFVDAPNKKFRLAVEININPEVDERLFGSEHGTGLVQRFTPSMRLGFSQKGQVFMFELDYQLFELLKQIDDGYRPNRQDVQDALQFSEFFDRILKSADKNTNVLLVHSTDGKMLDIKKPRFSKMKFEVGKVN